MRVMVINPNSTASMTEGIAEVALTAAASDVIVTAVTNAGAPPAIQGPEDGALAETGVLSLTQQAVDQGYDAVIIACFDDTGLTVARSGVDIPVIGIGHAAFLTALLYGARFSVITTLPVSVPVIKGNIASYGFGHACAKVHASGLPVLALEDDPEQSQMRLASLASVVAAEDGSDAIVLGCAGMGLYGAAMQRASGLPVIDGVAAAVGLARTAVMAGMPVGGST